MNCADEVTDGRQVRRLEGPPWKQRGLRLRLRLRPRPRPRPAIITHFI